MAHQRTIIRRAVCARLIAANTAAEGRVYPTRVLPTRRSEIEPAALAVYMLEDRVTPESSTSAPRVLDRVVPLVIEGMVMPTPGENVDDAIDAFALEVENAMHADPYLSQLATVEDVDDTADTMTVTGHGLVTGQRIRVLSTEDVPGGVSPTREYRSIVLDDDTIQIAMSELHAEEGEAVDITSAGSGTIAVASSTAGDSILEQTDIEILEDGDQLKGWFSMTYAVKYESLAPEAPSDLDDFLEMHVAYNLGGVVHEDNDAHDQVVVQEL